MRMPAPRRTHKVYRKALPGAGSESGTVLAGFGCVLAAVVLYAIVAILLGNSADDPGSELADDRPVAVGAKRRH